MQMPGTSELQMASEKWGLSSVECLSQNNKIIEEKFGNTLTSTMDAFCIREVQ